MERKEGQAVHELQSLPRRSQGYCTVKEISRYLKCDTPAIKKHMAALGIVQEPFVRREAYMTKVYKRNLRLLTEAEAESIITRHRSIQGREDEER